MTVLRRRSRQPRRLDAGPFAARIGSFRLHLTAEGKAARTVQGYTGAVHWFAAAHLLEHTTKTGWEQVDGQDIQEWMVRLLGRYSSACASIQFRALRQFFKWLAGEEELPDPMARLRAPKVAVTEIPVFTKWSCSWSRVNKTASAGWIASESSIRSPNSLSPSSPSGVCSEIGSRPYFCTSQVGLKQVILGPASIRLARSTSCSALSSGTLPICFRESLTGSSVAPARLRIPGVLRGRRYFQPVRVAGRLGDIADVVGEDGKCGLEAGIAGVETAEIARISVLQIPVGKGSAQ